MTAWAPFRTAAVGGLSAIMLAALSAEECLYRVSDQRRNAYVRKWARAVLEVLGVELTVRAESTTGPDQGRPRLVVANHRSSLDILIMLHLFGGQLLARKDIASWPAIGAMARRAGTLFVDRDDPASGAAAVQRMRERLRRKITLCVFPEGTTSAGDEVRKFQAGAFVAVACERGDVLPVGIAYDRPEAVFGDEPAIEHMKRIVAMRRLRASVAIGSLRPAGRTRVASFAEQVQQEVQDLVSQARSRIVGGQP
jgi:1-acyl-sn-glycerol-3-phosphate acyltransferase